MVFIYTENFYFWPRFKNIVKSLLGKGSRGPQAVEKSLMQGLAELGEEFCINHKPKSQAEVACVLSGVKTLEWAIGQKKKGIFKKLIAGPNLIVVPDDHGGIIKSEQIDVILVPSQWVKDFYISNAPELTDKIKIWAAGVKLVDVQNPNKKIDFLVYNKLGGDRLVSNILETLTANKLSYRVLNYGSFKQEDYFSLLAESKYVIYLSASESQGLAMFEAWARGVPTFVWDRGYWKSDEYFWEGRTGAPYVTDENGQTFADIKDFKEKLSWVINGKYQPAEFVNRIFSNQKCAKKYLEIVNNA